MTDPDQPDYAAIEAGAYGPIGIGGEDVPSRILHAAQREVRADGITPFQVAAVLHALADHSLQQRMLSPAVADLARRPLAFTTEPDPADPVSGLSRFFHGIADRIERREWEEHRW